MAHDIAALQRHHWKEVRRIYAEGLATGLAAFRLTPPLWKDWDGGHLAFGRFVALADETVVGWAAFAPVADT